MEQLAAVGVDMDDVSARLEDEGVAAFVGVLLGFGAKTNLRAEASLHPDRGTGGKRPEREWP